MAYEFCKCYKNVEEKIAEAATNYIVRHPKIKLSEAKLKIKNNFGPDYNSCSRFNYTGTIWCDGCGHEKECHPTISQPCSQCQAKIPAVVGEVVMCDDCRDDLYA